MPGAGGTQRLPRLVGPEKALEVILSGTPFGAKQALAMGRGRRDRRGGQAARGRASPSRARSIAEKRPLRKVRDRDDKIAAARGKPEIFEAIRKANARKFRGFEAWETRDRGGARRGRTAVRRGR